MSQTFEALTYRIQEQFVDPDFIRQKLADYLLAYFQAMSDPYADPDVMESAWVKLIRSTGLTALTACDLIDHADDAVDHHVSGLRNQHKAVEKSRQQLIAALRRGVREKRSLRRQP